MTHLLGIRNLDNKFLTQEMNKVLEKIKHPGPQCGSDRSRAYKGGDAIGKHNQGRITVSQGLS